MIDFTPTVRLLELRDAEMYLGFLCALDSQSPFMHYRSGERSMTVQGMRSRIKKQEKQGNSFVVLAFGLDDKPIGYFSVNGGNSFSTAQSATVAVGVIKQYRSNGVANKMLAMALAQSVLRGVRRWECTVVSDNKEAVSFYMNNDFRLSGYFRDRFYDGEKCHDELILELIL